MHALGAAASHAFPLADLWLFRRSRSRAIDIADLPEGEGKATIKMWREFSDTRWAASAGHLFGTTVISSETWTWLHSPAFRATPLDMKAEADLHFPAGHQPACRSRLAVFASRSPVNPDGACTRLRVFNAHNPWFLVMPDVIGYLQRVSYALRQGKPANDVAAAVAQ